MLESLNGSVPALQTDSYDIQIHGAPPARRHRTISTAASMDASHVQLKPMFLSAELLLLGALTECTWMTVSTYNSPYG